MEQESRELNDVVLNEVRAKWSTPRVDSFIAGGAEASSGNDVEGLDGLS